MIKTHVVTQPHGHASIVIYGLTQSSSQPSLSKPQLAIFFLSGIPTPEREIIAVIETVRRPCLWLSHVFQTVGRSQNFKFITL